MQDNEPYSPSNPSNQSEPTVNAFEPSGYYRPEDFNDQNPFGGAYNLADLIAPLPEPVQPTTPWGWEQV